MNTANKAFAIGTTVLQTRGTNLVNRTGTVLQEGTGDKDGRYLIHWKTGDWLYAKKVIKSWVSVSNLKEIKEQAE